MQRLCDKYNRAIDSIHQLVGGFLFVTVHSSREVAWCWLWASQVSEALVDKRDACSEHVVCVLSRRLRGLWRWGF